MADVFTRAAQANAAKTAKAVNTERKRTTAELKKFSKNFDEKQQAKAAKDNGRNRTFSDSWMGEYDEDIKEEEEEAAAARVNAAATAAITAGANPERVKEIAGVMTNVNPNAPKLIGSVQSPRQNSGFFATLKRISGLAKPVGEGEGTGGYRRRSTRSKKTRSKKTRSNKTRRGQRQPKRKTRKH